MTSIIGWIHFGCKDGMGFKKIKLIRGIRDQNPSVVRVPPPPNRGGDLIRKRNLLLKVTALSP